MSTEPNQLIKTRLHLRNRNRERYNLEALLKSNPELKAHLKPNNRGEDSVDFSDPAAVKILNRALLNHYYGIKKWEFPDENLCPPIPGRADYLHYMADLLNESNLGSLPKGDKITCLDVGIGANCIYPIIGVVEYGWNFIGSDIAPQSIEVAQNIASANDVLKGKIDCRLQDDSTHIFKGILGDTDQVDFCISNPPFHSSNKAAIKGSRRKVKNLTGKHVKNPKLNFSGMSDELIYPGGEHKFVQNMILQSKDYAKQVYWFSSLVSKQDNLKPFYKLLKQVGAEQVKTIPMGTGNKSTRIVVWSYLTKDEQQAWRKERW